MPELPPLENGFTIRRAEAADEPQLVALLERHVTRDALRRYRWIYRDNPQGEAASFLAVAPNGELAGMTSIFARDFLVDGKRVRGGVGFDAFVSPGFRRRGLARHLHAASRAAMARGDVPHRFMCGPPVVANLLALMQAGARVFGAMRYAGLPLTTRGVATMMRFDQETVLKAADRARVLDAILAGGRALIRRVADRALARPLETIPTEIDGLWDELAPSFRVIGRRDGAYLKWRYLDNPVCTQRLIALEQRGRLVGWAALELAGKGALLVDYLLPLERGAGDSALAAIVDFAARAGACRLTARVGTRSPYLPLFRRHGFLFGFSKEPLQVLTDDPSLLPTLLDASAWHLASGDLNPEAQPWSVDTAPDESFPVEMGPKPRRA